MHCWKMSPRSAQNQRSRGTRSQMRKKGSIKILNRRVVIVSQCTSKRSLCVIYVRVCVRARVCRCVFERTVPCSARYFRVAAARSLVRPSNVSPVLVDYPIYLQHQEGGTPLSTSAFTASSCESETAESDWFWGRRTTLQLCVFSHHTSRLFPFSFWPSICSWGSRGLRDARPAACRRWRKTRRRR